jgi:predicted glycosyltransferase
MQLPASLFWSKRLVDYVNHRLIKKFNTCWVPDFPLEGFSGTLSDTKKQNVKFIGMLSRFVPNNVVHENDLVVGLVSGPEPQREIFETLLIREFKKLNQPSIILRGLPHLIHKETKDGDIILIAHAPSSELEFMVSKAGIIISRSGYSTIMDLQALAKKRVIFVPTPGQTEQEYLAYELEKRRIAYSQTQDQFSLAEAILKSKEYNGFDASVHHANLLNEAVLDLLHLI